MDLLNTLLDLSEKKEINYTKKKLEKMTEEELEVIYKEYKRKELDDFNEAMTDVVIFKFEELMKKYELVKEDSELGKKLQNKKLFRKDLKTTISFVSPFLPFIGFLEGGVCIVSEVVDKMASGENKEDKMASGEKVVEEENKEDVLHQEESGST